MDFDFAKGGFETVGVFNEVLVEYWWSLGSLVMVVMTLVGVAVEMKLMWLLLMTLLALLNPPVRASRSALNFSLLL